MSKIVYIPTVSTGLVIKSIQRGVIFMATTENVTDATITSVDTSKTVVNFLGSRSSASGTSNDGAILLQLSSSTIVSASRYKDASIAGYVSYEVIEYSSGIKSIQRGLITFGATDDYNAKTITSVDPTKTIVRWLGSISRVGASQNESRCYLVLADATTLVGYRYHDGAGEYADVSYEVVEYT